VKVLHGPAALSPFGARQLLSRLQKLDASITGVEAEYLHFVDSTRPLSETGATQLNQLLTYGTPFAGQPSTNCLLVTPRPGTISPWSSKATDIIHNSGLVAVKRVERGIAYYVKSATTPDLHLLADAVCDRMTEAVLDDPQAAEILFAEAAPRKLIEIDVLKTGKTALQTANKTLGLALADDEIEYLYAAYQDLKRNPTDVELMMFAQINSEHCRHKIFNADWVIDGQPQAKSLFKMIKNTYERGGERVLSAYSDNAAVVEGPRAGRFFADTPDRTFRYHPEPIHTVIKVETHNHPTAIAPFPGAATGSGGEIRDEGATGRGAKPKMGMAGYTVSNLNLPDAAQPWEQAYGKPDRITSALDIMIEAPIGAASFCNEFGRPNLTGYFRTYEQVLPQTGEVWGYHKPIMIAGGLGNIRDEHVQKSRLQPGAAIIVLGGPAMLIGLGGGAASSMQAGASAEDLDFASVQRANAEIERRAQEVIDSCWALGKDNPIVSIHDVGAGGLSNALPELVHDSGVGAEFELRAIPNAEPGLSPLEIWCNEAQERYVVGVHEQDLDRFVAACERERCPYAVVGHATAEEQLVLTDDLFHNRPVDIPLSVLFGKPPKMTRTVTRKQAELKAFALTDISLAEAAERVLQAPAVGSKKFLITIGDRTVGGLVVRDQMVGPWQVPVSDVAVTASSFEAHYGEAMAIGERTPLALIDGPASGRMAVGEALTNLLAADIRELSDIKLSANWMAAAGYGQEDEKLYDTVRAVGEDFCPALGLTIPVGKDSLSMRMLWQENGDAKSVTSPLSVVITGFAPVQDFRRNLTPELRLDVPTKLIMIDLAAGKNRLGGSILSQVFNQLGNAAPDAETGTLKKFFESLLELKRDGKILAYHDRSDGGLFATVTEMAFAARCGLELELDGLTGKNPLEKLFNEELGVVIQVAETEAETIVADLQKSLGKKAAAVIGHPTTKQDIVITDNGHAVYENSRAQLETWWSRTSHEIHKLRDNADCADQEFALISQADPGLSAKVSFEPLKAFHGDRPKVAILREQGVNGQVEMAAAFDRAGFTSVDVPLSDIMSGRQSLSDFRGLAACGGFSYGDVLGAGEGWAKSILFNDAVRAQFEEFFHRDDTFSLGVCNGCQMLAALKELIPGAENWPTFLKNTSEQFEGRVALTKINKTPSIFFKDMAGSVLPIPVAHGEGRVQFANGAQAKQALQQNLVAMQYVDNNHKITETYPANPNGSTQGITSLTTPDGRATILMPHPERAFLTQQLSWHPADWPKDSPWLRLFQNARTWAG
jgi:phosphoribosylformylglycinamidine synthase